MVSRFQTHRGASIISGVLCPQEWQDSCKGWGPVPNPSKEAEGSPLSPCPAASGIYHGRASPQFCSSFHLSQQSVPALAPELDLELR